MSPPSSEKHVVGIDVVRLTCALLVMAYHVLFFYPMEHGSFLHRLGFDEAYALAHPLIAGGWVGVQVFFVISGFVIAYTVEGKTPSGYVRSRFLRLYPTIWGCAAVGAAIYLAIGKLSPLEAGEQFLASAVTYPLGHWIDGVYWTLPIEVAFYSVVFVFVMTAQDRDAALRSLTETLFVLGCGYWLAYYLCLAEYAQSAVGRAIVDTIDKRRTVQVFLLHHAMYFALGMAIQRRMVSKLLPYVAVTMVAAFGEIAHQGRLDAAYLGYGPQPDLVFLIFVAMVGAIAASYRWNGAIGRALGPRGRAACKVAGAMTYPLYLLHMEVFHGAAWLAKQAGLALGPVFAIAVISALAVSLAMAVWAEPLLRSGVARWIEGPPLRALRAKAMRGME